MNKMLYALEDEFNYGYTENGALTKASSMDKNLDFFYIAPVAKKNPSDAVALFKSALNSDRRIALRTLLWLRDVRGGAGARQAFRDCMVFLASVSAKDTIALLDETARLGRWDDILYIGYTVAKVNAAVASHAVNIIRNALLNYDFLCGKWMPRKGAQAEWLRTNLNMGHRTYRKVLVAASRNGVVVEREMCANQWNEIPYSKVSSLAFARYKSAFGRHDYARFSSFLSSVEKGEAKINAGAIYPHDILRAKDKAGADEQWNSLPNYLSGDDTGLVVVDVSGSMHTNTNPAPIDVAVGLGLYMAERARGPFKDMFITFSQNPRLLKVNGKNLVEKYDNMCRADWGYNTNIQAVFALILKAACANNVPQNDMPKFITIISDMEFDSCARGTNLDGIRQQYLDAGYTLPVLVFWNVNGRMGNVPANSHDKNVVLISGYSPAILGSVFTASSFSPMKVFLDTVMNPRYDFAGCVVVKDVKEKVDNVVEKTDPVKKAPAKAAVKKAPAKAAVKKAPAKAAVKKAPAKKK